MRRVICSFCDAKHSVEDVICEEGCCPECGEVLMPDIAYAVDGVEDEDEDEDEIDELEDDMDVSIYAENIDEDLFDKEVDDAWAKQVEEVENEDKEELA